MIVSDLVIIDECSMVGGPDGGGSAFVDCPKAIELVTRPFKVFHRLLTVALGDLRLQIFVNLPLDECYPTAVSEMYGFRELPFVAQPSNVISRVRDPLLRLQLFKFE
jgi:hypothetical protein